MALKPELPGGEAGLDPGVLGPPCLHPRPPPAPRCPAQWGRLLTLRPPVALSSLHHGGNSLPGGGEGPAWKPQGGGSTPPRTWTEPCRLQTDSPQAAVVWDAGLGWGAAEDKSRGTRPGGAAFSHRLPVLAGDSPKLPLAPSLVGQTWGSRLTQDLPLGDPTQPRDPQQQRVLPPW